ncbi:cell wall-binding repeat-containing protein [Desulfosporosinus sp. FKA]|uniref:cell wall-binding repeat-containing protein n=1 Tax=Desulfosporosinus sp. FKA TaxID=1969834 RepID=UPI000B4A2043|nr:cell wall-binding repeat-containing protein [Desulfosporosinus sp. FKA]
MRKLPTLFLTALFTFSSVLPVLASTDTSTISPVINRMAGQDRYETSSTIAEQGWPNGSTNCILAFGGNFTDSLAAVPLAKKYDAPILLTESTTLPAITKKTLTDLKTKNVTIIGGTGVISAAIDTELQAMGITTNRIYGYDKYETAIAVAKQVTSSPTMLFVCTSDDFTDALSISPVAAIKQDPIILVSQDSIPESVKNYISANNGIVKTYVIGDSDEISDSVANQFPNYERIAGNDSYSTNIAVNNQFASVFGTKITTVASGEQFPDALSGSALASKIAAPIILINNSPADVTRSYYQDRIANGLNGDSNVTPTVDIFGGTVVIPDSVMSGLAQGKAGVSHLSPVSVTTAIGIAPVLPSTVTATMMDGTTKTVNVTWPIIESSRYGSAGSFCVTGTIAESTTVKPIATVEVRHENPIPIITVDQIQQDILGTWTTSDGKYTLNFENDGTLEVSQENTGYTTNYKAAYSFPNSTMIKITNSSWTEEDNFVLIGKYLEIYNMGIPHITGNNIITGTSAYTGYLNHPTSFTPSTDPVNFIFMKTN